MKGAQSLARPASYLLGFAVLACFILALAPSSEGLGSTQSHASNVHARQLFGGLLPGGGDSDDDTVPASVSRPASATVAPSASAVVTPSVVPSPSVPAVVSPDPLPLPSVTPSPSPSVVSPPVESIASQEPIASTPIVSDPIPEPSPSAEVVVNDQGEVRTIIHTIQVSRSATPISSATPSSTALAAGSGNEGKGLSQGSIIGMAVAGSIAVLGIIAFFIWKFTRKRMGSSDLENGEAIKWPELNAHGGGGVVEEEKPHPTYAPSISANSSEQHLNVNPQYYGAPDPYNSNNGYNNNSAGYAADMGRGGASPAPPMNYGGGGGPQPQMMGYGAHAGYAAEMGRGGASPAPSMNQNGRMSPGPHMAYGQGR